MSSKKSLLTESEVRRFMKLAGVPSLNEMGPAPGYHVTQAGHRDGQAGSNADPVQEEYMQEEEPMAEEDPMEMDPEELGTGEEGGDKEAKFQEVISMLADLVGVDLEMDAGAEAGEMEEPEGEEEMEEPEGEEEAGEEAGAEDSEEEEGEGEEMEEAMYSEEEHDKEELQESKVVDAVLARVTARLIAEAKKKKEEKKKKMTPAEKMKAMKAAKEKKKKLEEANAAAPKATNSNGHKKGAGSATKGTFGVTSKVQDQKWDKKGKGDHEMETVSASSEHMTSHGSKNLATMGGNKKK